MDAVELLWDGERPPERRAAILAELLAARVPGLTVAAADGRVRRLAWAAAKGQPTLGLQVTDTVGRYRLLVPDRPDLSPGRLAGAVAVFSAIRRRFPDVPTPDLSFEETVTSGNRKVSGLGGDRRVRVDHELVLAAPGAADPPVPTAPPTGPPTAPPSTPAGPPTAPPSTPAAPPSAPAVPPTARRAAPSWLDLVVAHECWHTIEIARYRDTFELRRALGELLGVPTFEAAYVGMPGVSPERRAAALARIRAAVGTYATTKAIEGTAELFAHWWIGASADPLVGAFGGLVDRYLPAPVTP